MSLFRRFRAWLVLSLAATGTCLLAASLLWFWARPHVAAESLRQQLDVVPTGEIPDRLALLTTLGEPGMNALVAALGSRREEVAAQARLTLWRLVQDWQGPGTHGAAGWLLLAKALDRQMADMPGEARQAAAALALSALIHGGSDTHPRGGRLIALCEKILRESLPASPLVEQSAADQTLDEARLSSSPKALFTEIDALANPTHAIESLPGGGIPATAPSLEPSAPPNASAAATHVATTDIQPPPNATASFSAPAASALTTSPGGTPSASQAVNQPLLLPPPTAAQAALPAAGSTSNNSQAEEDEGADRETSDPKATATQELVPLLAAADSAAAAEHELTRRGFSPADLEFAHYLAASDPAARRRAAELVPRMRGIDNRAWLLLLGRDRDAEVRLTAITLLATSDDPAVLAEVKRLAAGDADPRIQDLGNRLLEAKAERATAGRNARR